MKFLETIFDRLQKSANAPVLGEVRDGQIVSVSGGELLELDGAGADVFCGSRAEAGRPVRADCPQWDSLGGA